MVENQVFAAVSPPNNILGIQKLLTPPVLSLI